MGFTDSAARVGAYTVLRVAGSRAIPLFEQHVRRLGERARGALLEFAAFSPEGIFRVSWDGARLSSTQVKASRLREGMPTRFVVSPFAGVVGRFSKPAPPSPYDGVRLEGVASLLTDQHGLEVFESCSASVVAWDGTSLVVPLESAPGVASTAEAELVARLSVRRARVLVNEAWPLVLINAVVGVCGVSVPDRPPFPSDVRATIEGVLS